MEIRRSLFTHAAQWAGRYADTVMSRDDLHLSPALISKAAAKRISKGIRVIEAYLRRILILLALSLEPTLTPDNRERAVHFWPPRNRRDPRPDFHFRVFKNEGIDFALSTRFDALKARPKRPKTGRAQVPARPLIARMKALWTLMANPDARARRLAWTLARRRPGLMLAPGAHDAVKNSHGTEVSATYTAMGHAILQLSRARPPPLGPVPRPPPRIRVL